MEPQFDLATMSDAERAAVERIRAGDVADFGGCDVKPAIRAGVLRHLAVSAAPVCGIRVRNARIVGGLDLSCTAMPAVVLEDCYIPEALDVSNAHLGVFSIEGSRFFHLFARGASIDGPFDFSDAAPFESVAWIDASKTFIRGGVLGCRAQLKTPPKRAKEDVRPWDRTFALRISEAEIRGDLWLTERFVADGGIFLDNTYIRGTFSMRNDTLVTACEGDSYHPGDAIHAEALRCEGLVSLNFGFRSEGRVWFQNANISKRFNISGTLKGTRPGYDWMGRELNSCAALMVDMAEIGTGCSVYDSTVDGGISYTGTKVGGTMSFPGTSITNQTDDGKGPALIVERSEIGGDLSLARLSAQGKVSVARTKVGGDFDVVGTKLNNATANGEGVALDARFARIAGEARPRHVEKDAAKLLDAAGRIEFEGVQVGRYGQG